MNRYECTVEAADEGMRLDKYLQFALGLFSRTLAQRIIEQGLAEVNGKCGSKSYKVQTGDMVIAELPDPEQLEVLPEDIPLDIVYEDDDLLVVNKPRGMVTHPAPGYASGTLVNALLFHCKDSLSGINGVLRPGIVHRLDKDTSGLLIVAKNDQSHIGLAEQIRLHSFTRVYEAVAVGNVKQDAGTINKSIGRSTADRKKMCVTEINAKNAVTHFRVLARYSGYTHLRLELETGRTHQIRVHMASLGHPIAGDPVYGMRRADAHLNGQCLHAREIGFVHPIQGRYLEFISDLPAYFQDFLGTL